jgi:hypothetical protein
LSMLLAEIFALRGRIQLSSVTNESATPRC